jgi:hypothetical protein
MLALTECLSALIQPGVFSIALIQALIQPVSIGLARAVRAMDGTGCAISHQGDVRDMDDNWIDEGTVLSDGLPVESPSLSCLTVVVVILIISTAVLICGWLWLQGVG